MAKGWGLFRYACERLYVSRSPQYLNSEMITFRMTGRMIADEIGPVSRDPLPGPKSTVELREMA
jgi:hypothetical protein